MQAIADGLVAHDWRVHRFNFPYMSRRQLTGRAAPPDRPEVLQGHSERRLINWIKNDLW